MTSLLYYLGKWIPIMDYFTTIDVNYSTTKYYLKYFSLLLLIVTNVGMYF